MFLCPVGAGTAGSIIASRLTEDPQVSVLLLEAGSDNADWPDTDIPAIALSFCSSPLTWDDYTVPQRNACLGMNNNVSTHVISPYGSVFFHRTYKKDNLQQSTTSIPFYCKVASIRNNVLPILDASNCKMMVGVLWIWGDQPPRDWLAGYVCVNQA